MSHGPLRVWLNVQNSTFYVHTEPLDVLLSFITVNKLVGVTVSATRGPIESSERRKRGLERGGEKVSVLSRTKS